MNRYSELNENARGILMEIGNIGTGNAVTSLSQMLDRLIDMECPDVRIMEFNEVPGMLGGIEEVRVGVLLEITGDIRGIFMFLSSAPFLKVMLEGLLGMEVEDITCLDPMSMSAVSEIGNIMCCSYINALTRMLDIKVDVSVPDTCVDMIHFANISDELLLIEDKYHFGDLSVISHVLFLPEIESLEQIFRALGEEYEK